VKIGIKVAKEAKEEEKQWNRMKNGRQK